MSMPLSRRLALALALLTPSAALGQTRPAESPEARARAFLAAYFAPLQTPTAGGEFPWSRWMTSGFHAAWRRALAKAAREGEAFPGADPVLDAQDYERPGDTRVEAVGGTADRPSVRVSFRVFARQQRRTTQTLVFAIDRGEWRLTDILTPREGGGEESLRKIVEDYLAGR